MTDKLAKVRGNFDQWRVDGILITGAANRRWLSGFTGSAGQLLVTRERAVLSTDSRYWEQAAQQAPSFEVYRHKNEKDDTLKFLQSGGANRIGFEAKHVTVAELKALRKNRGFTWRPLDPTIEPFRAVKSEDELASIRAAARMTDETIAQFPRLARMGLSERDAAWELEKLMRDAGADRPAFDIIVASGPNSALPHHRPGDRLLRPGDIVVVDLGAEVSGYKSDLTRSFYLGEPADERFLEIYGTVLQAQRAAIEGICPGVIGKSVDSLARNVIEGAGHGEHFGHGTGHSLGLEIHEDPRFSRLSKKVIIPENAVMTVEPGIYLPGYGGVRIEDLILVTQEGPSYLSQAPKSPVIPL
jgi:Xaa-Pro aminopeptidase